jgi:methionyl-tRNA formyltransferase
MKLLLMADNTVGLTVTRWLLSKYQNDIGLIVAISDNEILSEATLKNIPFLIYESSEQICEYIRNMSTKPVLGLLAWWPKIVKQPLLSLLDHGFINMHPSLLPYNRGKHYNFWAIVEQAPFGVSLHFVDDGVDTGDIVAQKRIPYDWEDTGASLYKKASEIIVELFKENYEDIRSLKIRRIQQDLSLGSFHRAKELNNASRIDLDTNYKASDLLNLIRAKTFPGYPACWFNDGKDEYEVRIVISRKYS